MIVHQFTIVRKKDKEKSIWLVSASGGRQLRGLPDETLEDLKAAWTVAVSKMDELVDEGTMTVKEAENKVDQIRQRHLAKRAKETRDG